jgi:hypothetical protein
MTSATAAVAALESAIKRSSLEERAEEAFLVFTAHNNFIMGMLNGLLDQKLKVLKKGVLPNGSCLSFEVRNRMLISIKFITPDGGHDKFFKQEHLDLLFTNPVPFDAPDCKFFIVRHGESTANDGSCYENPPLTPKGEDEAIEAGKAIQAHISLGAELIWVSSPLRRAVDTAKKIQSVLGVQILIHLDLALAESARGIGSEIQTRGTNAEPWTVIACDPSHPFEKYMDKHICNEKTSPTELWEMVVQNQLPPDWESYPNTDGTLLRKQLTGDYGKIVAMTNLSDIVTRSLSHHCDKSK